MKRWITYLLCLTAVACSDELKKPVESVLSGQEVYLDVETKGSGSKTPYIFYLVGKENTSTQGVEAFGTYLDAEAGKPLIPVEVGSDGQPENETYDSSKGLRAANGGYSLFVASPAVQMSAVEGMQGLKGYHYNTSDESGVYVSDPVSVTVGGVYLSDADGSDYVYDASSQILRQPRSLLKLKFACGTDIEQATLRSINLNDFISQGYYIPVEMRFQYSESDVKEQQLYPPTGKGALTVKREDEAVDLNADAYILSMNYKAVDESGNTRFPLPSLEIEIGGVSGSDIVTFNAPLSWDFRPQHIYEFTIVINSVYVNMTLVISEWDVNGEVDSEIGTPEVWQIQFPLKSGGVDVMDWESVDTQIGTIG